MRSACLAACYAACVASAGAQTLPLPQNVVNISASATVEVARDTLTIVYSTSRDGPDAGSVQAQLKQALDAALAEARKAARPGQLEVQTGNFSLHPRPAPRGGGISGWQGSAELVVSGRDVPAVAALSGRIQTLTIQRTGFSLSREARDRVDADVTAQAIAAFRTKADAVSRQFGFAGHSIREVSVSTSDPPPGVMPMLRMQMADKVAPDASLPVEAGMASVTASVSGSVQMTAR